jgi:hypothetical protein
MSLFSIYAVRILPPTPESTMMIALERCYFGSVVITNEGLELCNLLGFILFFGLY